MRKRSAESPNRCIDFGQDRRGTALDKSAAIVFWKFQNSFISDSRSLIKSLNLTKQLSITNSRHIFITRNGLVSETHKKRFVFRCDGAMLVDEFLVTEFTRKVASRFINRWKQGPKAFVYYHDRDANTIPTLKLTHPQCLMPVCNLFCCGN
jgi:hypothetical protein